MRPVNLIPPEERRDGTAKLRGGPLAYILVGALAALLAGGHVAGRDQQRDLEQQG